MLRELALLEQCLPLDDIDSYIYVFKYSSISITMKKTKTQE